MLWKLLMQLRHLPCVVGFLTYRQLKAMQGAFETERRLSIAPRLSISLVNEWHDEDGKIELYIVGEGTRQRYAKVAGYIEVRNEGNTSACLVGAHNEMGEEPQVIYELLPKHRRIAKIVVMNNFENYDCAEKYEVTYQDIIGNVYMQKVELQVSVNEGISKVIKCINSYPEQLEFKSVEKLLKE